MYKAGNLSRIPRELRKHPELPQDEENEPVPILEEEELEKLKPSLEWLAEKEEPWWQTIIHWKKTFIYRSKQIGKDYSRTIAQIYEDWPILKTAKGFQLLTLDFISANLTEHPNCISGFFSFYEKLVETRKPKHNHEFVKTLKNFIESSDLNEGN